MSQWSGLNRRPPPSLTPLFQIYKRARLYLFPSSQRKPLSVVRSPNFNSAGRSGPFKRPLTVIRDSTPTLQLEWAEICPRCFRTGHAIYHGGALPAELHWRKGQNQQKEEYYKHLSRSTNPCLYCPNLNLLLI